jgi:hypothetical protein
MELITKKVNEKVELLNTLKLKNEKRQKVKTL